MDGTVEQIARFLAREGQLRFERALAIAQALDPEQRRDLALALRNVEGHLTTARQQARVTSASIHRAIVRGGR